MLSTIMWAWIICYHFQMQSRYKELVGSQASLNKLGLNDNTSTKPKQESPCAC